MAENEYAVNLTQRTPQCGLEEAMSEIERELRVRERCYGRWVQDGKMTRIDARDRLRRMTAGWLHLDKLLTLQQPETVPPEAGGAEAPKEEP